MYNVYWWKAKTNLRYRFNEPLRVSLPAPRPTGGKLLQKNSAFLVFHGGFPMVFSTVCAEWMGQLTMIHGSFCFNTWLIIARLERTRENKPQARNKRFRYALSLFWSLSEIVSLIHEGCRNVWKKKKVFIIHDTGVLKQAVSGWRCQKHAQCSPPLQEDFPLNFGGSCGMCKNFKNCNMSKLKSILAEIITRSTVVSLFWLFVA